MGIFTRVPGAGEAAIRNIVWSVPASDAASVATELGKVPQPAVVEQVVNGSTLRLLLTGAAGSNAAMLAVTVAMAGIQCPKTAPAGAAAAATTQSAGAGAAASSPGSKPTGASWATRGTNSSEAGGSGAPASTPPAVASPVAAASTDAAVGAEAKAFTEARLLHRDVLLYVGGADSYGNLFGRVEHPAGDIAVELVKQGVCGSLALEL